MKKISGWADEVAHIEPQLAYEEFYIAVALQYGAPESAWLASDRMHHHLMVLFENMCGLPAPRRPYQHDLVLQYMTWHARQSPQE